MCPHADSNLMKTISQARVQNERRILKAAIEEFEQYGFSGSRMQRIADRAKLPKANIHYYFKNKTDLYTAVLNNIVSLWNKAFDRISVEDEPANALRGYIHAKLEYSQSNAAAARVFTNEIVSGAPHLKKYLKTDLRSWVTERAGVIQQWANLGKIDPINPYHLIFLIWGATQHYADYHTQVSAIMGKRKLDKCDYDEITNSLVEIILKGCGLKVR